MKNMIVLTLMVQYTIQVCIILNLHSSSSTISSGMVSACTNILVTPKASIDGFTSTIAYNADSPTLYGVLYHYPSKIQQSVSNLPIIQTIYDWDTGRYMGQIEIYNSFRDIIHPKNNNDNNNDEPFITYNVIGNGNDHGLVIGETTFGGISLLAWNQTNAIMDYGSLIYITLQYAQTVHEAIKIIVYLMDTYGYASGGESFSLADQNGEVWIMEIISRGNDYNNNKLGAVWVAQKIPDGTVAAHANHARIQTFVRDDPENVLYSDDVVDVAIYYGLYPKDADPLLFSFSDVYDPINTIETRMNEARVWSIFSQIVDPNHEFQKQYESYILGTNLTNRMPLYITPYKLLSFNDISNLMSSHYENTILDSSQDVGSGLFASPYRPRPLIWEYNNVQYHNERNIATAKTGWNFIGQIRMNQPPIISTIIWFACDDSSTSPRIPMYTSSTKVPIPYSGYGPQDGYISPLLKFDLTKAFWIQNMVSNLAYSRWDDIYPIVRNKIDEIQNTFQQSVTIIDEQALNIYYNKGKDAVIDYVTDFSVNSGNVLHDGWMEFYGELFVQFRDYYTIISKDDDPLCGCTAQEPGFSTVVKKRIVDETGDHYKVQKNINNNNQVYTIKNQTKILGESKELYRFVNDEIIKVKDE